MVQSGASISWEYLAGWEQQCDTRCDVASALNILLRTQQIDRVDILSLDRFLCGFSTDEIAIDIPNVKERMIRILALLEATAGYDDDHYLERVVTKYPKFAKTKEAYRNKLIDAGRTFEGAL